MEAVINKKSGKIEKLFYDSPLVSIWKSITRLFLKDNSINELIGNMDEIISEASDKQWFEEKYSEEDFNENFVEPISESIKNRPVKNPNSITSQIVSKISIIDVADKYGLMPLGKKKRCCPFHPDGTPSLHLDEEMGFKCFGCEAKGNLIEFIYQLRKHNVLEVKNG
jgi:hypothetical protein